VLLGLDTAVFRRFWATSQIKAYGKVIYAGGKVGNDSDIVVIIDTVRVRLTISISCNPLLSCGVSAVRIWTLLVTYISKVPGFTSNPSTH
jgi:hypothetical protein